MKELVPFTTWRHYRNKKLYMVVSRGKVRSQLPLAGLNDLNPKWFDSISYQNAEAHDLPYPIVYTRTLGNFLQEFEFIQGVGPMKVHKAEL